ncbi:MAG: flagellar biosynthetic protein FliO [Rhodospirillaceae bacterium]|nr:flagellar biosynthetic protein FliO [Rhodospirillaceae bacterium]
MELTDYIRFVLALIVVLGLILAMTWALKRFGLGAAGGGLISRRRLRTVETALIDGRHRLVLVRRDAVEHLLLVGPNTSQVIESGIASAADDAAAPAALAPATPISSDRTTP